MLRNYKKARISITYLLIITLTALLFLYLVDDSRSRSRNEFYDRQVRAAQLMLRSMKEIRSLREEMGITIDSELDPNRTGMIGEEFTSITTTLGNLQAKRTAVNPDFAALLVEYFSRLGLMEGDYIAVGASGSFPGLILAVLSASEVMNLKPLLIYSLGASMYGANIPEFTFLQMLNHLNKKELITCQPLAVSLGGNRDRAESLLLENGRQLLLKLARHSDAVFIHEENLTENIKYRREMYAAAAGQKDIKCFINIGGAAANFGSTNQSLSFPNGLVLSPPAFPDDPERGLIFEYTMNNIPVIHLLNICDLAAKNGIQVDPFPLPEPGESGVYFKTSYNKVMTALFLTVIAGLLLITSRLDGR